VDIGDRVSGSMGWPLRNPVLDSCFDTIGSGCARCAAVAGVARQRGIIYRFKRTVARSEVVEFKWIGVSSCSGREKKDVIVVVVGWGTLGRNWGTHFLYTVL
jgi:hypothetical protein